MDHPQIAPGPTSQVQQQQVQTNYPTVELMQPFCTPLELECIEAAAAKWRAHQHELTAQAAQRDAQAERERADKLAARLDAYEGDVAEDPAA